MKWLLNRYLPLAGFLSAILEATIRFPKKYNPVYDQDSDITSMYMNIEPSIFLLLPILVRHKLKSYRLGFKIRKRQSPPCRRCAVGFC